MSTCTKTFCDCSIYRFAETWAPYADRDKKQQETSTTDSNAQRTGFSLYDEFLIRDKYPSVLRAQRFWTASCTAIPERPEFDALPVFWDRAIDKVRLPLLQRRDIRDFSPDGYSHSLTFLIQMLYISIPPTTHEHARSRSRAAMCSSLVKKSVVFMLSCSCMLYLYYAI